MSLAELQKYTFKSRYAKWLPNRKRREAWKECVDRSRNMMLTKYQDKDIDDVINDVYDAVHRKEILGSQRALQFGGDPILIKNERIFNCCSSYADRPRFFQEAMFLLLCGCGVGFSVQKHHVKKLPKLVNKVDDYKAFIIPDSIEGWADAVGILVNSYFKGGIYPDYEGKKVAFKYHLIRPAGADLSSGIGKAPGAEPLKKAIVRIRAILNDALEKGQKQLTPIQVYDIVMHASDAVLSGGVRRSATICLFSVDDEEMMNAKIGNWFEENPQRGRSNNSVVLLRDKTSREEFLKIFDNVRQFGEPGFYWTDSTEITTNPCFEILFKPVHENGESGWQFCNLSTINCSKIKTKEDFLKAVERATIIGTLQAGFTNFKYLGKISQEITERESLLGVSMTGIMESPDICLDPKIQKEGAKLAKKINKEFAKKLGINQAARITCCKPEGSSSCLLGTTSGIHPSHSRRYIRRTQCTKTEAIYNHYREINPRACEDSVWSANDTDGMILFCIETSAKTKQKRDFSALDLLEIVKSTQQNWVKAGKNDSLCVDERLCHNVSNTITVKEDEWDKVGNYLYNNRNSFSGVSLLSEDGDKDYPQAPFMSIFTAPEIVAEYGECSLFVSGLIEKALELYDDDLWRACDVVLGIVSLGRGSAKKKWVEQCHKFAGKYLDGNLKKLTYLMKDVYNWKLWLDLNREYKEVDYETLIEEENNTNFQRESACAGGKCDIL